MNILLTGGTGFIGSHLIKRLLTEKHNISLIVRQSTDCWRIKEVTEKVHYIYSDQSSTRITELFSRNSFDGIIHLATVYKKSHETPSDIQSMNDSNISLPSLLLSQAVTHNVKFFINTGSLFEYARSNNPVTEHSPISPYNYYAATKLAFENILSYYCVNYPLKALTLRLFYPYGEMDNEKIIPLVIKSIINDNPLDITKGEQQLNFTYISDIVEAYVYSIRALTSWPEHTYEIINIGQTNTTTLKDIVSILTRCNHKPSRINVGHKPYTPNEIMYFNTSIQKAQKLLGWTPKINIEEGLQMMYNYYSTHKN